MHITGCRLLSIWAHCCIFRDGWVTGPSPCLPVWTPRHTTQAFPPTKLAVKGSWSKANDYIDLPDPLNGGTFIRVPDTQGDELKPFVDSLRSVPKSGLHNFYKAPERYVRYGDVSARVAAALREPATADFFARLIQRVAPKSYPQAMGEVIITRKFFENFGGDNVRFTARGFMVAGDHPGQHSMGVRWPYGPVGLITPFNFPLEIPALQLAGALFMGNKPLLHVDHRVSIVMEQLLRLLHACDMPPEDADLLHGRGPSMSAVLHAAQPRSTLFTGSSRVAEKLAEDFKGKVYLEDAGFDWKVLGPDVSDIEYVAWQCDQDAYACSGQKCSAQSVLFLHDNWARAGLLDLLAAKAATRNLGDLTIGPVLTWKNQQIQEHLEACLSIPGSALAFGGLPLTGHSIPAQYGAFEPTAVTIPLQEFLKPEHFAVATTELFGPFQVIVQYGSNEINLVLEALERMKMHLTAAIVSNDTHFVNHMLANTVNGTTYAGIRARTTGGMRQATVEVDVSGTCR